MSGEVKPNPVRAEQAGRRESYRKKLRPRRFWRYKDGALPNSFAMAYALFAHLIALAMLASPNIVLVLLGFFLCCSTLIVAAYLVHELAHSLVFYKKSHNLVAGEIFSWICGASYANFGRIQRMHMRHHADRADIACFDYRQHISVHPKLKKFIYGCEWAHIPAIELLMHYQVLIRPFTAKDANYKDRVRVVFTFATRHALFLSLFLISPLAVFVYALSYLVFIKVLYLGDAFAHTYESYMVERETDPVPAGARDAEYDRLNTFSNLISRRWPWLNLLNLNFGYHNAHHDKPSTPWYRLPKVQRTLYDEASAQYLPYREVLFSFHKNRLHCILPEHDEGPSAFGPGRADHFLGVHGVSFLSII